MLQPRRRLVRECIREATGVFLSTFPGVFFISAITTTPSLSSNVPFPESLFHSGWLIALGRALAVVIFTRGSSGHFNPSLTIAMSLWRKFPKSKVPWYIASQLAGGILAAALAIWMHGQQRTSEGAQLLSHLTSTQGWAALGQADHVNLKHIYLGGLLINLLANVVVWAGMGSEDPHVPLTYTPLAAGIASGLSWISAMGIETNFAYAFCLGMAKSGSSQPYLPHADYSSLFVSGSFGLLATLGAVAVFQNWRERSVELKPVTMSRKGSCTPRYFEN